MQSKGDKTIIATMSDVQGNVKFGVGCFLHPGCSIIAEGGDIIIGDYNIIEVPQPPI